MEDKYTFILSHLYFVIIYLQYVIPFIAYNYINYLYVCLPQVIETLCVLHCLVLDWVVRETLIYISNRDSIYTQDTGTITLKEIRLQLSFGLIYSGDLPMVINKPSECEPNYVGSPLKTTHLMPSLILYICDRETDILQ